MVINSMPLSLTCFPSEKCTIILLVWSIASTPKVISVRLLRVHVGNCYLEVLPRRTGVVAWVLPGVLPGVTWSVTWVCNLQRKCVCNLRGRTNGLGRRFKVRAVVCGSADECWMEPMVYHSCGWLAIEDMHRGVNNICIILD